MIMNYYDVLLNARAQHYVIEALSPYYLKCLDNPKELQSDHMNKNNEAILKVLATYKDKLEGGGFKNFLEKYLDSVAKNKDDQAQQKKIPTVGFLIWKAEMEDYGRTVLKMDELSTNVKGKKR